MIDEGIQGIIQNDERYALEAYEFIFNALHHTQKMLGRTPPPDAPKDPNDIDPKHHVSGRELMYGVRDFALQEFGFMARTVLKMWGVNNTADFGEIVFNLIDAGLMSKTDRDSRDDFSDVYDLDESLVKDYRIQLEEAWD